MYGILLVGPQAPPELSKRLSARLDELRRGAGYDWRIVLSNGVDPIHHYVERRSSAHDGPPRIPLFC